MYTSALPGYAIFFTSVHSRIPYNLLTLACKSSGVLKISLLEFSLYEPFEIYLATAINLSNDFIKSGAL